MPNLAKKKEQNMMPFIPDKLPISMSSWKIDMLMQYVSDASSKLAEYNGILTNPAISSSIFLSPLEMKEAVISSKIEGTVTTLDEVMKYDAGVSLDYFGKQGDLEEVLNYRSAMRGAKDWIDRGYPIDKTVICSIQKELLHGVRGADKTTGDFRKEQVWIGAKYSSMEEASYIPPLPENVPVCMQNLIDYIQLDNIEVLTQTAISHAQFEIIHPFMDGNGRTGRILIPLLLWKKKRLILPNFYISEFLEANRDEYSHRLNQITQSGDWEGWVYFFMQAVKSQSELNSLRALKLICLYEKCKNDLFERKCPTSAIQGLDSLFSFPIFSSVQFKNANRMTPHTASRVLNLYKELGFIEILSPSSGRTPEFLIFPQLYDYISKVDFRE